MINNDDVRPLVSEMVEIVRSFQAARRRNHSRGVVGTRFAALKLLRAGDIRTTELAEHLLISLPVASRTIAALEDDGYVVRHPDPTDARASLLSITDAGRDLAAARDDQITELFAESLSDWTPQQAADAAALLANLREHATEVLDQLASTPDPTPTTRKDRV